MDRRYAELANAEYVIASALVFGERLVSGEAEAYSDQSSQFELAGSQVPR
jgi:hypothetical protein